MVDRPRLYLIAAICAAVAAPTVVRAAEPVATAPIPPPLPAVTAAGSAHTPATATEPKGSAAKREAAAPARKRRSAVRRRPAKHAVAQHAPHHPRQVQHHAVARGEARRVHPSPPPPIRQRYYAGYLPPYPPPWYDRSLPPGAYYYSPWQPGPTLPW